MTASRPLVLLDPFPRTGTMILSAADRARLEQLAEVITVESGAVPDSVVDECLPRLTAILGQTAMPKERLDKALQLRAIFNVEGNLFPNVDYGECFARGIRVASAAPVFARPVAEYALALALDLVRGITRADRLFRAGGERYGWRGNVGVESLFGATVGIIGYGNIGRALTPLLAPFACSVLAFDPWLPAALLREHGVTPVSLEMLLEQSRIVFVLAAPTTQNRHFIGAPEIARMRRGAGLILLSRADVADYSALRAALDEGRIEAAIDVFPVEPVPQGDPLRACETAILSSHRAGGLEQALKLIGEMAVDDLELVLRGLPPVRLQSVQPETARLLRSSAGMPGGVVEGVKS